MINWINKHRVLFYTIIGFIIIFLFIIIPIIINEMYLINKGYITVWDGSDVLTFYGVILSFIGTIFLGGLSLWQNERLNKINNKLVEHQYKPFLTVLNRIDERENNYTWFRKLEQNCDGVMINNGYSSITQGDEDMVIGIQNIGLGPAVNIKIYMHKLTSVDGLKSLDEIDTTNIENFYDKIHFEKYDYYDQNKKLNEKWLIYTISNLGISNETNKLNLVFSYENIKNSIYSIIEFQYENTIGNHYKQYIYRSYSTVDKKAKGMPISKIYSDFPYNEI